MKIAISWQTCRQTRFGARATAAAMTTAFLLAAVNLFAQVGPTNVTTIAGGYPQLGGIFYGYVDGQTNYADFDFPAGLALEPSGDSMFIADCTNNAVRWISNLKNSSASEVWTFLDASDGISLPVAVAVDSADNVYVLNRAKGTNGCILEFSTANFFKDLDQGPAWGSSDLVATNATHLTNATAMMLDGLANLYVTCNSNTVVKVTPAYVSSVVGVITNAGADLRGVAVLDNGQLALTDAGNNGIWVLNPANGVYTNLTGFHGAGDTNGSSRFAAFNHPENIAKAGNGWLVVADRYNHKVKTIDASGHVYRLFGVRSSLWTDYPPSQPYPGLVGGLVNPIETNNPIGVQAREPVAIVVAPDGSVYDSEVYYHVIRHATSTGLPAPLPWPPAPPTGLTVSPLPLDNYGRVTLTWTASSGATNYNIYRTTGGPFSFIASTAATTYIDTNVIDGTVYGYVITASNAGGEGPPSDLVIAISLYSPAPTNLIVTKTNFGLVSLAWSPSAGATSYNIKRSTSANTESTIASTTSTIYSDTNVVNGGTYYYVVSAVNLGGENPTNSNEVTVTVPIPPPPSPSIGWFDYEGTAPPVTVFYPISGTAYITHNDLSLAIEPIATTGVATYYTDDGSNPSPTNGTTPPVYMNGTPNYVQPLPVTPMPDLTIKAVNVNSGGSSAIVTAEFIYQVGNPNITGNNAAQFTVSDITTNAQFLYTTDGSDPRTNANATVIGPVSGTNSGVTLSLQFPANTNLMLFQIVGFRDNYLTSSVVSQPFSISNYVPTTISFGFASGPGSSHYIASPGQSFIVPVGLSLLPSAPPIYGLQFNVTITNLASHPVNPGTIDFVSLLGKPDVPPDGYYQTIPPLSFISDSQPNNDSNAIPYQGDWYQSLNFTDTNNEALLGVGWLEVYGRTNLYNTLSQNLLTYPILRGNEPYPSSQSIVGGYSFGIPTNANPGDVYQIQIGRPSATTFPDGLSVNPYGIPVVIAAPAKTNLLGPSSINALKNVTIGSIPYLVGDVYPANWFNAGDFGSSNLVNVDIIRVFDFAAYPVLAPPAATTQHAASDLFDALDSSGNLGAPDLNPADVNYGYWTNASTYPASFSYTNYDYTYYVNETNGVPTSTTQVVSGTNNVTVEIDLTTYRINETFTSIYIITNFDTNTLTSTITTNVDPQNYFVNIPPGNNSSLFSSSDTLFSGSDTTINQIAFGDGVLDVCDVYVTFRRSLDTNNLVWFQRFWTNGVRVATASYAPGIEPALGITPAGQIQPALNSSSAPYSITNIPEVNFTAGDYQGAPGKQVSIPVTASVFGPYPLRVAMLNISVVPLDGSPALTTPISFSPGSALGAPSSGFTTSDGPGNYAAAWLNSAIAGISNNAPIGTLQVTIPANATGSSAYAIHFDHASGSPNGLASLPKTTLTGLITLSSRNTSTYGDGIPDSWRLRWFGTVNNQLSVSNACPTGDGVNNWKKYVAGVDPNTPNDFPSVNPNTPPPSGAHASIYWPTVSGKQYAILSSKSLFPGNWTTNTIVTGNGATMLYNDGSAGAVKFYRVLILQ